jgi:hypothetical protein
VLDGVVQSVTSAGRFRLNDTDVDASTRGRWRCYGRRAGAGARSQAGRRAGSERYRQIGAGERISYSVQGRSAILRRWRHVACALMSANTAIITGGSASDLANGKRVRVRAVAGAGQLEATQITFVTP